MCVGVHQKRVNIENAIIMTVTMTSYSTEIKAAKSILQILLLNHRDFHRRSCMNVLLPMVAFIQNRNVEIY